MVRWLACLAMCACGRIGFDPAIGAGDGGIGTGDGGGGASGDGSVPVGVPQQVTDGLGDNVALVWTGSEIGMVWVDLRDGNAEIYFRRIDATGKRIGADVRVTNDPAASLIPALTWNGSGYAIVWLDKRDSTVGDVFFTVLDASGTKLLGDLRLTSFPSGYRGTTHIAWNGSEYGVAWDDNPDSTNSKIYFRRVSATGLALSAPTVVADTTADDLYSDVGWHDGWRVTWDGNLTANVYYATVSASGTTATAPVRVNSWWGIDPTLLSTGANIAVGYPKTDSPFAPVEWDVGFSVIAPDGTIQGTPVQVSPVGTHTSGEVFAVNDKGYLAMWAGGPSSYMVDTIYAARLAFDGTIVTPATAVPGPLAIGTIVGAGNRFAQVWRDSTAAPPALYLRLLDP